MGRDLFSDCDPEEEGEEDLSAISIDRDFARRFEHNKRREALHRLDELKRQGFAGSSSDEDDDDDDDDDEEIAGSIKSDLQFFDALIKVKNKDPLLSQKDAELFPSGADEDRPKPSTTANKKAKPLYLKDVMAQQLIEEGPEFDECDEHSKKKHGSMVYKPEQKRDIDAFLDAEKEALESGDEDEDDIFKEKEMDGDAPSEDEDAAEFQKKSEEYFGKDGCLDTNEMYLKSFFRDKMWIDKEEKGGAEGDDVGVSEDEDELDKQDRYEAEYNFRHEELKEGDDRVLGHSRVVEGSVRKKTNSRKAQRKSKEERMALAKKEREEEVKHLKNVKMAEIQDKLQKLKAIAGFGGGTACGIDADDLEEEFDPEEYDKKMRDIFDDAYYNNEDVDRVCESGDDDELEKPDFAMEDELLGLPKDYSFGGFSDGFEAARERVSNQKEGDQEDQEEEADGEEEEGVGKRKKKKLKISFKEKMDIDKVIEEYFKLDYEDTIGDLRTRFKYKSVPLNRYGLNTKDILMAKDKDLNQYVSLTRLAPYRPMEWKVTYHQKLKKESILQGKRDDKKCKKAVLDNELRSMEASETQQPEVAEEISRRRKRRLRQAELKLSQSRLMAYGKISSKPHKKKR